jgi:hypothetical protein
MTNDADIKALREVLQRAREAPKRGKMKIKCLYCGMPNKDEREDCRACGAPLPMVSDEAKAEYETKAKNGNGCLDAEYVLQEQVIYYADLLRPEGLKGWINVL